MVWVSTARLSVAIMILSDPGCKFTPISDGSFSHEMRVIMLTSVRLSTMHVFFIKINPLLVFCRKSLNKHQRNFPDSGIPEPVYFCLQRIFLIPDEYFCFRISRRQRYQ